MEDAFDVAEENFVLLPDFVNAAVVQVEVIDHAIYDSGELVIPGMVVEDKAFNFALCRLYNTLCFQSKTCLAHLANFFRNLVKTRENWP